jgi:hypothetical protein
VTSSNRTPIAVVGAARSLSKAQREFNRLSERIVRERARLAAWEACREQCSTRVLGELDPLDQALRVVRRRFLLRADALLAQPGEFPKRKQRGKLRALLVALALDFLARGRDAEIEGAPRPPRRLLARGAAPARHRDRVGVRRRRVRRARLDRRRSTASTTDVACSRRGRDAREEAP